MSERDYRVHIQPLCEEDGGGYLAVVPDLPGCMSDGETEHEALDNVQDAIREWISTAEALGRQVPRPKSRPEAAGRMSKIDYKNAL